MTNFFEIRVENLEPKEEKKKSSAADKKSHKKSAKKWKWEDSNSNIVESSVEFFGQIGNTTPYMKI